MSPLDTIDGVEAVTTLQALEARLATLETRTGRLEARADAVREIIKIPVRERMQAEDNIERRNDQIAMTRARRQSCLIEQRNRTTQLEEFLDWQRRYIACDTVFAEEQKALDARLAEIGDQQSIAINSERLQLKDRLSTLTDDRNILRTGRWSEGSHILTTMDLAGLKPGANRLDVLSGKPGLELLNRHIGDTRDRLAVLEREIADYDVKLAEMEAQSAPQW